MRTHTYGERERETVAIIWRIDLSSIPSLEFLLLKILELCVVRTLIFTFSLENYGTTILKGVISTLTFTYSLEKVMAPNPTIHPLCMRLLHAPAWS